MSVGFCAGASRLDGAVRAAADDGPTRRASIQNRRRVAESKGPPVSTWPATLNTALLERRPSRRAGRPLRGDEVSESCLHRSAGRVLRNYPVDQVDVHGATGWLGQTNARMPLLRARSRSFCAWLGALKMRLHERFWHAEMLEHIAAETAGTTWPATRARCRRVRHARLGRDMQMIRMRVPKKSYMAYDTLLGSKSSASYDLVCTG